MSDFLMEQLPDWSGYVKYKEKDELSFDDGATTDRVHAEFFEQRVGECVISVGVFSLHGQNIFCAWGYKDEEHCAMHSVMGEGGDWLPPQVGCPIKLAIKDGEDIVGLRMPIVSGLREFYFE